MNVYLSCRDDSPADPDLQDALFNSKLDVFASEYNHLLVSQLDSQRKYFEGLLQKAEDRRLEEAASRQEDKRLLQEISQLTNAKNNLEAKLVRPGEAYEARRPFCLFQIISCGAFPCKASPPNITL